LRGQWSIDKVAFASNQGVYIIDGDGDFATAHAIGGAQDLIYPSWFPGAGHPGARTLALMAPGSAPHRRLHPELRRLPPRDRQREDLRGHAEREPGAPRPDRLRRPARHGPL